MYDIEQEAPSATTGRWDIYGPIHKGLRLAHGEMIRRLGSADWSQDQGALLADLDEHLRLGAEHLGHEETHIHPALEARTPGASAALDEDHEGHRARFTVLQVQICGLRRAVPADRPALGRALYLSFARLVAEDLAHMNEEETVAWPKLCNAFTDSELQGLEMAIIGSLSPADNIAFMRIMLPAMSRPERAGLLGGMKAGAPPEALAAVLQLAARPTLSPEDWADLEARGLVA